MPATSEAQRRAMYAAAEGKSTLGIPKSVGEEFIGKDEDDELEAAKHEDHGSPQHAQDADSWITVHPNGSEKKGSHVLLGEGGVVKAGMGGKFNGKNIKNANSAYIRQREKEKSDRNAERIAREQKAAKAAASKERSKDRAKATKYYGYLNEAEGRGYVYKNGVDVLNEIADKYADSDPKFSNEVREKIRQHKDSVDEKRRVKEKEDYERRVAAQKRSEAALSEYRSDDPGSREYLTVPYSEKDKAKSLGAKWDPGKRSWYYPGKNVPEGLNSYRGNPSDGMMFRKKPGEYERIHGDDPSLYGEEVLGHEGERWGDFLKTKRGQSLKQKFGWDESVWDTDDEDDPNNYVYMSMDDMIDCRGPAMTDKPLALDRASIRRVDEDGHMHIERTPISKATVNPYYGREIPGWQELRLNPDRVYYLLRDPEELEKAAATFDGKPLLLDHEPVSSDAHPDDRTVGAVGQGVKWEAPYLTAPLTVWRADAIGRIEDGSQKELSSAYRYRPDMTPGTYQGQRYDGVMRDIIGNHVALVHEGRAGSDVVVGDSAQTWRGRFRDSNPRRMFSAGRPGARAEPAGRKRFGIATDHQPKESRMAPKLSNTALVLKGALMATLAPRLAQDANIDLNRVVRGVTAKNFADRKAGIISGLTRATKGKLAQDADLEDIVDLLDSLEEVEEVEAQDEDPEDDTAPAMKPAADSGMLEKILEILGADIDDEKRAALTSMIGGTGDEDPELPPKEEEEVKPEVVDKPAMDAAIRAAVARERQNAAEISAAREAVRGRVGALNGAFDSAADVYKSALIAMDVNVKGVHPSAFRALFEAMPKAAAPRALAQDAAARSEYETRFPNASRLVR